MGQKFLDWPLTRHFASRVFKRHSVSRVLSIHVLVGWSLGKQGGSPLACTKTTRRSHDNVVTYYWTRSWLVSVELSFDSSQPSMRWQHRNVAVHQSRVLSDNFKLRRSDTTKEDISYYFQCKLKDAMSEQRCLFKSTVNCSIWMVQRTPIYSCVNDCCAAFSVRAAIMDLLSRLVNLVFKLV